MKGPSEGSCEGIPHTRGQMESADGDNLLIGRKAYHLVMLFHTRFN